MLESQYQARLIQKLEDLFPGCVVLKNDTALRQGFPDLTILFFDRWAVLEVKASLTSPCQPNQEYYVEKLSKMSFSAFICPETEEEVLDALQHAFTSRRAARVPKRK